MRKIIVLLILAFIAAAFCACNDVSKENFPDASESSMLENSAESQTAETEITEKPNHYIAAPHTYTPAEFEELLSDNTAMQKCYIPWQKILPFGELKYVEGYDKNPNEAQYYYAITDENENQWFIFVYRRPLYEVNHLRGVCYYPTEWHGNNELLTQKLLPDGGLPESIYTVAGLEGFYVDDLDDPTIEYFYQAGVLRGVRIEFSHYELNFTVNYTDQVMDDIMNSTSAPDTIPPMFASYSELQKAIENIRENIVEHVAKYEAAA